MKNPSKPDEKNVNNFAILQNKCRNLQKNNTFSLKNLFFSIITAVFMIIIAYIMLTAASMITKDFLQPVLPNGNGFLKSQNMQFFTYQTSDKKIANSITTSTKNNTKNTGFLYPEILAYTASTTYAKIGNNAPLFKNDIISDTSANNIWFILPPTYFVEILSMQNSKLAYVNYNGIKGYVETKNLIPVTFTPTKPFLDTLTFSLSSDFGTHLRELPSTKSNYFTIFDAGTKGLVFIGETIGEVPNDGQSDKWYYCIYEASATKVYKGYVYSENLAEKLTIPLNTETLDVPRPVTPTAENPVDSEPLIAPMNDTVKWVLITLLTLPTILIFVLLIKKPKTETRPVAYAEVSEELTPAELQNNKNSRLKQQSKHLQNTNQTSYIKRLILSDKNPKNKNSKNNNKQQNQSTKSSRHKISENTIWYNPNKVNNKPAKNIQTSITTNTNIKSTPKVKVGQTNNSGTKVSRTKYQSKPNQSNKSNQTKVSQNNKKPNPPKSFFDRFVEYQSPPTYPDDDEPL